MAQILQDYIMTSEISITIYSLSIPFRHSIAPRFISWPQNQDVVEGDSITLECIVENCTSLMLSNQFIPVSKNLK